MRLIDGTALLEWLKPEGKKIGGKPLRDITKWIAEQIESGRFDIPSNTEDTEMPHKFDEDGLCINCRESIWSSSRQFCYLTSDITNGGSADD